MRWWVCVQFVLVRRSYCIPSSTVAIFLPNPHRTWADKPVKSSSYRHSGRTDSTHCCCCYEHHQISVFREQRRTLTLNFCEPHTTVFVCLLSNDMFYRTGRRIKLRLAFNMSHVVHATSDGYFKFARIFLLCLDVDLTSWKHSQLLPGCALHYNDGKTSVTSRHVTSPACDKKCRRHTKWALYACGIVWLDEDRPRCVISWRRLLIWLRQSCACCLLASQRHRAATAEITPFHRLKCTATAECQVVNTGFSELQPTRFCLKVCTYFN